MYWIDSFINNNFLVVYFFSLLEFKCFMRFLVNKLFVNCCCYFYRIKWLVIFKRLYLISFCMNREGD